jgi:hypothetical protein
MCSARAQVRFLLFVSASSFSELFGEAPSLSLPAPSKPSILVRYGNVPVAPSDDADDEGGISDWVSLTKQATTQEPHPHQKLLYRILLLPAKFRW